MSYQTVSKLFLEKVTKMVVFALMLKIVIIVQNRAGRIPPPPLSLV